MKRRGAMVGFMMSVVVATGVAAATGVVGAAEGGASSEVGRWQAGVGKAKITPESPMWMSGYAARKRPADGTATQLWAKALLLQAGDGQRCVLVTLDLVGIDRKLADAMRTAVAEEFGLAAAELVFACSHTHSGPVVAGNLRPMYEFILDATQQQLVRQYSDQLVRHVVAAVGQAVASVGPARLSWGSGKAAFAVNRRENKEADVPALREQGLLKGPSDHDVPVLAVRADDGSLQAVVFGYACHATVLDGYQWSGDYPGYAQMELERRHPETVALFWAGCGGDQNPIPRRKTELAEQYGVELASAVDKVLAGEMETLKCHLSVRRVEIDLPLAELPTRETLEKDVREENPYMAARAKMLLEQLDRGEPLSPSYPYPVQLWELGDQIDWVFLGGEVVVDYALRIKSELQGQRTWVAGYSNDVMAYIPSRRVLLEGGYEGGGAMVYYGLPTVWAPQVEETILGAVHSLATPATR